MVPKIVYFNKWMDPIGPNRVIEGLPKAHLVKLDMQEASGLVWEKFREAHGYRMLPATETFQSYYPNSSFIERCPNLLCISSSGVGYDQVDVELCTDAGILVMNQAGANSESVAQHTLGMMLVLSKQMIQSDRAIRKSNRDWTRWTYMGHELTNRTIGLIGLGNIGRRVAQICRHIFDMRVIAFDPFIDDTVFLGSNAVKVSLAELMTESHFVSVHCPLSNSSRGMIGKEEFDLMRKDAIFISTARGGIHDEKALESILALKKIAGAGLDVFESEPPSHEHPILAYENTIVSPHIAGITSDCLYNMAKSAGDQWVQVFSGEPPRLLVNPDAWLLYRKRFKKIFGVSPKLHL